MRSALRPAQDVLRPVRTGHWRAVVADDSMRPALEPGDWLLLDPTTAEWPRRGTVVVAREPGSDLLVVKRVAAGPGDVIRTPDGPIRLAADEAWLLGDDRARSRDSRAYGPVALERLIARAWFRYGPGRRIGRL